VVNNVKHAFINYLVTSFMPELQFPNNPSIDFVVDIFYLHFIEKEIGPQAQGTLG
jgi:hypothetical protein